LSFKINKNRVDYFKKCCSIFWEYDEEAIQDGYQLKIKNNGDIITVNIYKTGRILVQGSLKCSFLKSAKEKVERIINTIDLTINESNHQLIHRAQTLKDFIETLDINSDINRMTVVIICDTSCEILLKARAELIAEKKKIQTKDLKLDFRDDIYKFINGKDCIEVMEKRIKNLRKRRNKLVHQGDIPTTKDAEFALEVLSEYLEM